MKPNSLLILAAGALALVGCSTPKQVGGGPMHARTFSFVKTAGRPVPGYADNREPVHRMIQESIAKNLAARGVARVDMGGDITVGYLVIIGNNASTELISDYFGWPEQAAALHDKAQSAYTSSKNPNYFEAGTLLIDLVDSKSFKLLKRGYATRTTLRNLPDEAKAARIQEVVDEILRDVRVTP
jgi:Domain of unknown function (DUF4136)